MSKQHQRIFYGWWVVLTAAVGMFWGIPITVFSFGVFLKPLMLEFHAGRAAVSLAYTLQLVVGAISAPPMGWLIDRYGPRKIILPASAMYGLILLCLNFLSTGIRPFYVLYLAVGLFAHCTGPIPYGTVICHWFDRRRGLALGLSMLGIGSGAMLMPLFAQRLITSFGWRAAYAILGAAVLLISVPVVGVFLKERPEDMGMLPDGAAHLATRGSHVETDLPGLRRDEAWRNRNFWLMLSAFALVGASVQGCLIHVVAMLTDSGATPQTAALGSSIMGVAVLVGRVGTGYVLDRFFAPRLAAFLFSGAAVGIAVLGMGSVIWVSILGAFFVGLSLGAEVDFIAYLISRYFGLRSFAKLYSVAFAAFVLAGALGPLAMGAGFDLTGSYQAPLAVLFTATVGAAALMTRLGPYPSKAAPMPG